MTKQRKDKGVSRGFKTYVDESGRVCTLCGDYKTWENFVPDKRKVTGRQSRCRPCARKETLRTRSENVKINQRNYQREYKKKNPLRYRAGNIRGTLLRACSKHGIDRQTTPTIDQIHDWLKSQQPYKCYYSGEPVKEKDMNIDHKQPISRGGDNKLDNLCVCSGAMNRAKGNLTEFEFKELLRFISGWEDGGKELLKRLRQTRF
jgi:5-methylcytosine-specific restriction endonuclease McrA